MGTKPWYKRYPSNFISGTSMLTAEEKGVYGTLIDLMYDARQTIPDDAAWLARTSGCSTRRFNQIKDRLVELGKITIANGRISNPRFERQEKPGKKSPQNQTTSNGNKDLGSKKPSSIEPAKKAAPENLSPIYLGFSTHLNSHLNSHQNQPTLNDTKDLTPKNQSPVRARARSRYQKVSIGRAGGSAASAAAHVMDENSFSVWRKACARTIPKKWSPPKAERRWKLLPPTDVQHMIAAWHAYIEHNRTETKSAKFPTRTHQPENWFRDRIYESFLDEIADKAKASSDIAEHQDQTVAAWNGKAQSAIAKIGETKFFQLFIGSTIDVIDGKPTVVARSSFLARKIADDGAAQAMLKGLFGTDIDVHEPGKRLSAGSRP